MTVMRGGRKLNIKKLKEQYDKWYKTHPVSVILKRIIGVILFTTFMCILAMGNDVLVWYEKTLCFFFGTIGVGMIDLFK